LLLASCAHPRQIKPKTILERPTWSAIEETPGQWWLYVRDSQAEKDARAELCNHSYICQSSEAGKIIAIQRVRK
jgi:hypothetical protein